MLRIQCLVLLGLSAQAAILPPTLQEYTRKSEPAQWKAPEAADVWEEYGLSAAEEATYQSSGKPFRITAWRFADSTGAMSAFFWQRPASATPIRNLAYAAKYPDGVIAAGGNYLLRVDGLSPSASELRTLFQDLPQRRNDSLPILPSYLPSKRNSAFDRYIIGKNSLSRFLPGWTADQAGLDFGAEAVVTAVGAHRLVIFRYPTPQIARVQTSALEAKDGMAVHRSGPLMAVLFASDGSPVSLAQADPILKRIQYRAAIVENEDNPNRVVKDAANIMLSIFSLAGILLLVCFGGGVMFGLLRVFSNRQGAGHGDSIQMLHLEDR